MNQNTPPVNVKTPREIAQQKYNTARVDLLVMIGLTVLNVVLAFTGSDSMMLFSAIVPYVAAVTAAGFAYELTSIPTFNPIIVPLIAIVVVSIAAYFICWIFSKKHFGFMIAALCMFIIDTVAVVLLYMGDFSSGILDLAIHAIVLFYLINGVVSGIKLRKMPEETAEEPIPVATLNGEAIETAPTNEIK